MAGPELSGITEATEVATDLGGEVAGAVAPGDVESAALAGADPVDRDLPAAVDEADIGDDPPEFDAEPAEAGDAVDGTMRAEDERTTADQARETRELERIREDTDPNASRDPLDHAQKAVARAAQDQVDRAAETMARIERATVVKPLDAAAAVAQGHLPPRAPDGDPVARGYERQYAGASGGEPLVKNAAGHYEPVSRAEGAADQASEVVGEHDEEAAADPGMGARPATGTSQPGVAEASLAEPVADDLDEDTVAHGAAADAADADVVDVPLSAVHSPGQADPAEVPAATDRPVLVLDPAAISHVEDAAASGARPGDAVDGPGEAADKDVDAAAGVADDAEAVDEQLAEDAAGDDEVEVGADDRAAADAQAAGGVEEEAADPEAEDPAASDAEVDEDLPEVADDEADAATGKPGGADAEAADDELGTDPEVADAADEQAGIAGDDTSQAEQDGIDPAAAEEGARKDGEAADADEEAAAEPAAGDGGDKPPRDDDPEAAEPGDDDGEDGEKGDKDGERNDADAEDADAEEPMSRDEVMKAFNDMLNERDPDKAAEMSRQFWEEVERRGLAEGADADAENLNAADQESADPDGAPDGSDSDDGNPEGGDKDESADETPEEPEPTPEEARQRNAELEDRYRDIADRRDRAGYPPDSLAARHLDRQADAVLEEQIRLDSIINPENKESNDAYLEQKAADRARAEHEYKTTPPDDRFMRLTSRQLEHLRGLASEELARLDPVAAGSAPRSDALAQNIDHIDRMLGHWKDVLDSKHPLHRALLVGREALERTIEGRANGVAQRLDNETEKLMRVLADELKDAGKTPTPEAIAAKGLMDRVTQRRAAQRTTAYVDGRGYFRRGRGADADHQAARALHKHTKEKRLEDRLQEIDKLRREKVSERRRTVKEEMEKADREFPERPHRQIRGRGNASPEHRANSRPFGAPRRPANNRPPRGPGGGSQRREERRAHKEAVVKLRKAQAGVRKARAQLNQHSAVDRTLANVPLVGSVLVPKTVEAQASLQAAVLERDSAARNAYPRVPSIIGRYV